MRDMREESRSWRDDEPEFEQGYQGNYGQGYQGNYGQGYQGGYRSAEGYQGSGFGQGAYGQGRFGQARFGPGHLGGFGQGRFGQGHQGGFGQGGFGQGAYSQEGYGQDLGRQGGLGYGQDYRGTYGQWPGQRGYPGQMGDWDDQRGRFAGRGPKGYRRSDDRIREDVSDRLTDNSWLDASNVEVKVENGMVTLTGNVASREDKRRAEDIVMSCSGVKDVINQIHVDQGIFDQMADALSGDQARREKATTVTR